MVNFKVLALKFILVIAATNLDELQRVQVIIVFVCLCLICYYMLTSVSRLSDLLL